MTTVTSPITNLKDAIESRDAEGVWYADDAVLTILDPDNPPAAPGTYHGCRRSAPTTATSAVAIWRLRRRPDQHSRRARLHAALSVSRQNSSRLRDRRSFG